MSFPDWDLRGRVAVVTGSNTGIGYAMARGLARLGATLVLGCRSREKAEAARERLVQETGHTAVSCLHLDLASLAAVRNFATRLEARHDRLQILVNNAGIWPRTRELSADGIELTWATNVLGPFLLTQELRPLLERGAPARIINLASMLAHSLDLDDVQFERRRFAGRSAYAQSKQANRMLTWELARRLAGTGITANAVHPGLVASELFRDIGGLAGGLIRGAVGWLGRSVERGADTTVWLAANPELEKRSGEFWYDRRVRSCRLRNLERERALWSLCERMTRGADGES